MFITTPSKSLLLSCCFFLWSSLFYSCEEATPTVKTEIPQETTVDPTPTVQPRQTLEGFAFDACDELVHDGCATCAYQLVVDKNKEKAPYFFVYGMGLQACVKINGAMVNLTSRAEVYGEELLKRLAYAEKHKDWIVLPKTGPILYFGNPIPEGVETLDFLVHVLSRMDDLPATISIRQEGAGMAVREIRDLAEEAVKIAILRQENSDYSLFEEELYYNEAYQLVVDTKPITEAVASKEMEEEASNIYKGDLILKDKEGNVLHTQPVSGTCGC